MHSFCGWWDAIFIYRWFCEIFCWCNREVPVCTQVISWLPATRGEAGGQIWCCKGCRVKCAQPCQRVSRAGALRDEKSKWTWLAVKLKCIWINWLGACYPWPEGSQVCRHAFNSFPKTASFLHSLWVYWWLFFTCKSPTHNNIEPKPSTIVIWASGISTFMYCNYFVSSYLSNIIQKLPWHLFCYWFWAAKNSAGGSSIRFSIITWIFVDFNNFSAVRFSFWWYDILMLNFCSAYLYTCPGSAFSPFSITDFFSICLA